MNQPDLPFSPRAITEEETYRPALAPARGLMLAWALSLVLLGSVAIMVFLGARVPWPTWLMLAFFLAAACLMTAGRWVDSRTLIQATPQGLTYQTPLQRLQLPWEEVRELRLLAAGRTWRIVVLGGGGRIPFRVPRAGADSSPATASLSLPGGEQLLRGILGMAHFASRERLGGGWVLRARDSR